jgi:hypothetical protein
MSVRIVRWAFVSGGLAHAWYADDDAFSLSLCGNRAERTWRVDKAVGEPVGARCQRCAKLSERHVVMTLPRNRCPACGGTVATCKPREGRCGKPADGLALAWPDEDA